MGAVLQTISISRTVADALGEGPVAARVLACFPSACDLLTDNGSVIALVAPRHGNGPLNVVVEGLEEHPAAWQPQMEAALSSQSITMEGHTLDLSGAETWEPRPPWAQLRGRVSQIRRRLPEAHALAARATGVESLLAIIEDQLNAPWIGRAIPPTSAGGSFENGVTALASKALDHLDRGMDGDQGELAQGSHMLAGLGRGLTPAGDDFLMGVMIWAWMTEREPKKLCDQIVSIANGRTSVLAGAMLKAARRGECSQSWHEFLGALGGDRSSELAGVLHAVLQHGATSGTDTLAGFLWAGLRRRGC